MSLPLMVSNFSGMYENMRLAMLNFQRSNETRAGESGNFQYTSFSGLGNQWFLKASSPALSSCVRPRSNSFAPLDFAETMAFHKSQGVAPNLLNCLSEHPYL